MKANEAPKKIYLYPYSTDGIYEVETKPLEGTVEYTRTDAFIEKAKKWFEEHFGNRLKWEITTYEFEDMQSMVENFGNYMEGE